MFRQQCRAYSRAAGYRAACELLRTCEGSPQLQGRLLSTLAEVLSGSAAEDALAGGAKGKGGYPAGGGAGLSCLSSHHVCRAGLEPPQTSRPQPASHTPEPRL